MSCTEKEMFEAMDSRKVVRVTCVDGQVFTGPCWAYSAVTNQEDFDIPEATLEIGSTSLLQSEIEKIEYEG